MTDTKAIEAAIDGIFDIIEVMLVEHKKMLRDIESLNRRVDNLTERVAPVGKVINFPVRESRD